MKPRGFIRGTFVGMLMGFGLVTLAWSASSSLATEGTTRAANAILVIDGKVAGGMPVAFDLARLKALPATTITTMTPWTEGENRFDGVRLSDLLAHLGIAERAIIADSVDDYRITIPLQDIRDYDVIVAYAMNGRPLPRDDKGPLWIVYPFSEYFGLQKDLYFARAVWQLNRLTVQ